jgi:hypothetical protein
MARYEARHYSEFIDKDRNERKRKAGKRGKLGAPIPHHVNLPRKSSMQNAQQWIDSALEHAKLCQFSAAMDDLFHGIKLAPDYVTGQTASVKDDIERMERYFTRCKCQFRKAEWEK